MFICVISDCRDANARSRVESRISALFGIAPSFLGVACEIEASGNLIDILDAGFGRPGIVLVNVAPRNGGAKKYPNGTPFGYFYYKKTLVISSLSGCTLALAKEFSLIKNLKILDLAGTVRANRPELAQKIISTQFRSLEFLPLAAYWLTKKRPVQSQTYPLRNIGLLQESIWWIDNFGNAKTTLSKDRLDSKAKLSFSKAVKGLKFYPRLKDVPDNAPALIEGSSGIGDKRFLEIVIQGGNAAKKFNLKIGPILAATEDD